MQLDSELIDGTGDFSALRFVFSQFTAEFFRVGQRARARLLWLRHYRKLTAFLAGQSHSPGRLIRDQRRLAVLAMKENVGIARHLPQRILHAGRTSRRCAEGRRAIRETREITPKKRIASIPEVGLISRLLAYLAELSVRDALARRQRLKPDESRHVVSILADVDRHRIGVVS